MDLQLGSKTFLWIWEILKATQSIFGLQVHVGCFQDTSLSDGSSFLIINNKTCIISSFSVCITYFFKYICWFSAYW